MSKGKHGKEAAGCPVGSLFKSMEETFGADSGIGGHLHRSQLELLKAIRAWADGRIEHLERDNPSRRKKKVTRIKVD
jgi:hypothetical protein